MESFSKEFKKKQPLVLGDLFEQVHEFFLNTSIRGSHWEMFRVQIVPARQLEFFDMVDFGSSEKNVEKNEYFVQRRV